ncbi:MAG: ATP-binding protein [Bacteroidetes bacterium]|nr:ATP-binding protein [Bacteroidota bacterium]
MNPIQHYHKRYEEIKLEKKVSSDIDVLADLIENDNAGLNNFFMAAFGMSTLILRMGAVIQMCRKFELLDEYGDALFTKQVLDNLRETLPSDTSWKNVWNISAVDDAWKSPTLQAKGGQSLLDRFVTFRNKFVHQTIQLTQNSLPQLSNGVTMFEELTNLISLFENGNLELIEGKYHWVENNKSICMYPYVQVGMEKDHPYIFQGLHKSKEKVAILNLIAGNEEAQEAQILEQVFEPMRSSLQGGAGQVFDHSERIAYYQSCFVGRDREKNAILDFCAHNDNQNILCVKSPAGMGKGALIADVIQQLKENKTQVLYHFCGAGMQNSLHAALYHFILQGTRTAYWDRSDETIDRKLNRLPSKLIDVIHLFQSLLSEHLNIQKNNTTGNLVIIIDGLDEAQVAYSQLKISDWFYSYNEKEEPEEDWRSASNIRWVFTYRCDDDGKESFYQFPKMKECVHIDMLQPLQGLSPAAVDEAFKDFKVSDDFKKTVIEKAEIV